MPVPGIRASSEESASVRCPLSSVELATSWAPIEASDAYPDAQYLASPAWLMEHNDGVVNVRTDEHYHGKAIAGARLAVMLIGVALLAAGRATPHVLPVGASPSVN